MFMSNNGNNRAGWKNPRYDELIREANAQLDRIKRRNLLRQAEILLVREEAPIVPLYYYAGLMYYRDSEIRGIFPNVLDVHPLQGIYKISSRSSAQRPRSELFAARAQSEFSVHNGQRTTNH